MLLWTVVVGAFAEAFPVEIERSGNVRQLFDMLKRINPQIFDEIDSSKVELYLAKDKLGEWLQADAPEVTQLMCGEQSAVDLLCRGVLNPETQLDKLFESTPRNDQTQVVVRIIEETVDEQSGEIMELQCLVVGRANDSSFTLKVKRTQDVHQLKENILASRPRDFSLLSASNVHLYPAQSREGEWLALDQPDVSALRKADSSAVAVWLWDEMHPCTKIGDRFDSAGCQAIHVLVRVSEVLAVVEDDDDEHQEHKKPFCDVAEAMRDAPEVTRLVDDIKMVTETGENDPGQTPFILLANSSGTGKTQMAFNLMARREVEVFYIVCGDVRENMQVGYSRRSSTFLRCVEQDMPTHLIDGTTFDILLIPHCLTFAFIWALLTGTAKFDRPRTRDEVCRALEARADGSSKMPVFFLDDFPLSVKGKNDSALQFMRNVFCSFGLPVIVSARNTSAASLVATEPAWLGGYHALWCVVWPTLPPFQYLPRRSPMESNLQEIVRHSRPSLSKLAVEHTLASPFTEAVEFVEYMDAMAGALVLKYMRMTEGTRPDIRLEQMCLLLAASNSREMLSGAFEPGMTGYFVNNHFARFHDTKTFTLHWGCSPVPLYDGDRPKTWQSLTEIPGPQCDALLHLCFMGGKTAKPMKSSTTPISFRQAFETLYYESEATKCQLANTDDTQNFLAPGAALEALVAGAIVAASRQNGSLGSHSSIFCRS